MPNQETKIEELKVIFSTSTPSVSRDTFNLKSDGSFEGWLSSYNTYFDVQVISPKNLLCETVTKEIQGGTRYWCVLKFDKTSKRKKK